MSWHVLAAYVRRDVAIARSYRIAFALQLLGTLILLFVVFQVSKLVAPAGFAQTAGIDTSYFAWVVIALALLRPVQIAITGPSASVRGEQTTGTLEAVLATPVRPVWAVVADAAFDVLLALVACVTVILLAWLVFGAELSTGPLALLVAVLGIALTVAVMLAIGMILAAGTLLFKQILGVISLVVGGLVIVSGAWYPLALVGGFLEVLGWCSPIAWGLEVERQALLADHVEGGLLAALAGAAVIGLPLAAVVYERTLARVRRTGSLSHY